MTDTDTLTHDDTPALGNTKAKAVRARRGRRFCFTLNNYTDLELDTLTQKFTSLFHVIGREVGENGTPHLQGYVEYKNPISFESLKKVNNRIHWELAKGDRASNIKYCTKEGRATGTYTPTLIVIQNLYPWQKYIENLVLEPPDNRSIYWFWEMTGNFGKTSLIKYLLHKYPNIAFSRATKSADIVTVADELHNTYIFDFARSQEGFTPWNALEQLKDGLISDSKLKKETRNVLINCPHIICFANWMPDMDKLSCDRLIIVELNYLTEQLQLPFY